MTTDQEATGRYFPYVGAAGWLAKLHQLCTRSMPQRIEVDWLKAPERLGLNQSNARQLLGMMERIGWLEADGTVTATGRCLRLTGDPWHQAMREMVQQLYSDLISQIETAPEFSLQDIDQFFVAATNIGQSGRRQMAAVFRWFLHEAGLTELEEKVWASTQAPEPTRRTRTEEPKRRRSRNGADRGSRDDKKAREQETVGGASDDRLGTIAAVLRITIDGSWEEERMLAVFRMLDKLLKGESPDD